MVAAPIPQPPALSIEAQAKAGVTSSLPDIDPSKLEITLSETKKPLPAPENMLFGQNMTEHMLLMHFSPENGWSRPIIKPYGPLELDPASSIFHYTPALFEGMKAYLGPDGEPRLFRPDLNMERMLRSADRVALPEFDAEALLVLIKRLVQIDKRWIPTQKGYSLYIRPTLIGTRPSLGVAASSHAALFVIMSPAGPYFPKTPKAKRTISLYAETEAVRSWPGGTGAYKLGVNYSPCFKPQREAARKGFDQILWILEGRVTEAGQMNFFAVVKREDGDLDLITPPLDGTILPGVTRTSVLELAPLLHVLPSLRPYAEHLPAKVHAVERPVTTAELVEYSKSGKLLEAFGSGTAAVLAPIGRIGFSDGQEIKLNEEGVVGKVMYEVLVAIQEGRVECCGWSVSCE